MTEYLFARYPEDLDALEADLAAVIAALQAQVTADIAALAAHLADTVDAHDASAISFSPTGALASTDVQAALAELDAEKQPLDSDLTAIAALSTVAFGRSLLTLADATALAALVDSFFLTPTEGNAAYQQLDADLTAIAALSTATYGRSLLTLADVAALVALFATDSNFVEAAQDVVGNLMTSSEGTGDLDFTYTDGSNTLTAVVKSDAISFAKMQNIATDRLLGRDTAATGDVEEIALSTGLEWTGSASIRAVIATQEAAEDGTDNTSLMTPLRVAQGSLSGLRAGLNITGGATLTYDGTNVLWSARLIVISDAKGTEAAASTAGYWDINCPTSGNVDVVGTSAVTATASGIPLGSWQALYYDLDAGSAGTSTAFHIIKYDTGTANFLPPPSWVLICVVHGDAPVFAKFSTGDIVPSGSTVVANTGRMMRGLHSLWVPATAMYPRTTNGAAAGTAEMATNKNMFKTLDFDTTTQEFAQFEVFFPKSWDLGTVTFKPVLSHASGSGNAVFGLAGVARSSDDAGDVAFGTAVTSDTTVGTANDIYIGPTSSAMTIAGTPAVGDTVQFQVNRTVASDSLGVDARLHGILLLFTIKAGNDV